MTSDMHKRNRRTGLIVLFAVALMVAVAFASVPLYRIFCSVTGVGGPAQMLVASPAPEMVRDRDIEVRFNAGVAPDVKWHFAPEVRSVNVKVGQEGLINYIARNDGAETITGTAVYNVVPEKAAKYFHKTQCFCFGEQTLVPGQSMNMPVMFFVDPAIMDDPNLEDVQSVTLSYTFYRTESPALARAIEDFQNN